MALYDAADCLARVKRLAGRPATDGDKGPSDTTVDDFWYALLTDAQLFWVREIATHVPAQMTTIEKLTTADSGVSYDFSAEPLGNYELRESPTGRLLLPGPDWDPGYDFIPDGQKIRFQGQKTKTFANGPWARYVKVPGVIASGSEPTLKPTHARQLLVFRACIIWAERGGLRDPAPYQQMEDDAWFGDPLKGRVGLIGALKQQAFLQGGESVPGSQEGDWWRNIDSGAGYTGGG